MTKKEELLQVIENGMIGVFSDGKLGLYINGTFIKDNGGIPLTNIDENGNLIYSKNIHLKEVFTLKKYAYCADINHWVSEKNFLDYKDKVVWEYKEQISFIQFLKDNDAYEAYMHNVKIENQRWDEIERYIKLQDLKKKSPGKWLLCAFDWTKQKESAIFWGTLSKKWVLLCNNNIVWE